MRSSHPQSAILIKQHIVDKVASQSFTVAKVTHAFQIVVETEHATLCSQQVVPIHIVNETTAPFISKCDGERQFTEVSHLLVGVEGLRASSHKYKSIVSLCTIHPRHAAEEAFGEGSFNNTLAARTVK